MANKVLTRKKFTGKKEDMVIIRGVHPTDLREPKVEYSFVASDLLISQLPCVGDLVNVISKQRKTLLYITDISKWEEGCFEPEAVARCLYQGEKFSDFEYDTEA